MNTFIKTFPKSLAWEWVVDHVLPLLDQSCLSVENQMRTFVEHTAIQISFVVMRYHLTSVFLTGGGVYHSFLLKRLAFLALLLANFLIPAISFLSFSDCMILSKSAVAIS